MERDTSIATTTLRLLAVNFWFVRPHWGRAAASNTRNNPASMKKDWNLEVESFRNDELMIESFFSRLRRKKLHHNPAIGTRATSASNSG